MDSCIAARRQKAGTGTKPSKAAVLGLTSSVKRPSLQVEGVQILTRMDLALEATHQATPVLGG
jgi:hypothetical protein